MKINRDAYVGIIACVLFVAAGIKLLVYGTIGTGIVGGGEITLFGGDKIFASTFLICVGLIILIFSLKKS